jgi:hypothetical protein
MADDLEQQPSYIDNSSSEDTLYRSEVLRATKEIITDDLIEEKLKNFPLWSIISKSMKLTFLSEIDAKILEQWFEASVCQLIRSVPPCSHKSEIYIMINQARMIFYTNVRRAVGTSTRGLMNERIALLTQQKQILTSSENQGGKTGFFQKLFGRK